MAIPNNAHYLNGYTFTLYCVAHLWNDSWLLLVQVYICMVALVVETSSSSLKAAIYMYQLNSSIIIIVPTCVHYLCSLGNQYFIPVSILVPQDYPRSAPQVYIKPTPGMELVMSHMVNQYGRVEIDFLKQWNRVSNGTGLVRIISRLSRHCYLEVNDTIRFN